MKCEFEKQIITIDKKMKNAKKSGNPKDILLAFKTIDPEIFGKLYFGLPKEKFIDYCEQYRGFLTNIKANSS
jgi:hypothetical protein